MLQKNAEKIIVGTALAFAASALLPVVKSTLRPMLEDGLEAGGGLLSRARSLVQIAREELEDIVAEAQFERLKKQLDREIASSGPEAEEQIHH